MRPGEGEDSKLLVERDWLVSMARGKLELVFATLPHGEHVRTIRAAG